MPEPAGTWERDYKRTDVIRAATSLALTAVGLRDDHGAELYKVGPIFPLTLRMPPLAHPILGKLLDKVSGQLVIFTRPEIGRELFTRQGDDFDYEAGKEFLRFALGASSPFLINGPEHGATRRFLVRELNRSAIEKYRPSSLDLIDRHIDRLPVGERVELFDFFAAFSQELIIRTVFGTTDQGEVDDLRYWLDQAMRHSTDTELRLAGFVAASLFSDWRRGEDRVPRWMRRATRIREEADDRIQRKVDELRAAPNDSIAARAIAFGDDRDWSDKQIRDLLVTLLVAGHDTSVSGYSWAMDYALHDPDTMAGLRAEADTGLGHAYAQSVAAEALRLRPPVWGPFAIANRDTVLAGRPVRKGAFVWAPGAGMHAGNELYECPREFRPDRFVDEAPDKYGYVAFGAGRHRCPGQHFFLFESGVVLQRMASRLDLRPVAPPSTTYMAFAFFNRPRSKVPVEVLARHAPRDPRPAIPETTHGDEGRCPAHSGNR